ncbi:MAG TPA: DUF4349 domain-containing protein [Anaerolineales bacterium]|nr:DUF4349 domain-containing protein [Anaerolineales bacterium]
MNVRRGSLIPLLLVLAACSPAAATEVVPSQIPATSPPVSPTPSPTAVSEQPIILQSASLSMIAADPVEASAALQALILEAGGYVVSSSSWSSTGSGYASLSARVPPEALASLRRAAVEAADQIQSDSMYSQDVSLEYGLLLERAAALDHADGLLQRLLSQAGEPEALSSYILLRELLIQEQKNVESQIQNYRSRMSMASLDVSWSQAALTPMPIE